MKKKTKGAGHARAPVKAGGPAEVVTPPGAVARGRGRPTKLTPVVVKTIVKALKAGNYRLIAARKAGVSYESFATWYSKGKTARAGPFKEFYDAVIGAETDAEMTNLAIITRGAKLDAKHAKWFLAHRFRERWADNLSQGKLEVSGAGGKPLQIEGARDRLLARLDQLAAKRAAAKKTEGT